MIEGLGEEELLANKHQIKDRRGVRQCCDGSINCIDNLREKEEACGFRGKGVV